MDGQYSAVVRAFTGVLGERLVALVVYGSAVTGDAIPGFSDLDLFVVMREEVALEDAVALQRLMPEPAGVAYVQPSYRDAARPQQHLVPGAFRVVWGDLPEGFVLDEPELRRVGLETLRELPALVAADAKAWTGAIGEKRLRHVRLMTTRLKPAVRSTIVQLGEPVVDAWRAPWDGLVRRWQEHDPERAGELRDALELLRATPIDAQRSGEAILRLLTLLANADQPAVILFDRTE